MLGLKRIVEQAHKGQSRCGDTPKERCCSQQAPLAIGVLRHEQPTESLTSIFVGYPAPALGHQFS
jgi:hypothetical protein